MVSHSSIRRPRLRAGGAGSATGRGGRASQTKAATGSLHVDLLALAHTFHARLAAPATRHLGPALLRELAVNPELVIRFQETFLATENADFAEIIERAVARGELAGLVDPTIAHVLLAGSQTAALYVLNLPVDDAMVADIATAAAAGITALADRDHGDPDGAALPR